jgi:hypothetical protein
VQQGYGEPEGFPRVGLSPLIFVVSLLANAMLSRVFNVITAWRVVPFICQMLFWPLLLRHRRSRWPSLLKSALPTSFQLSARVGKVTVVVLLPLVSQIWLAPVVGLRQMSNVLTEALW